MNTVDTKTLQQQVLDDFAFHLGYDRDHSTGNYKRELYYTSHSPFRRLKYNTMVMLYNRVSQATSISDNNFFLMNAIVTHFPKHLHNLLTKAINCETPITQLYLQRSKKQNKILCQKHQIKFSSCEAGQIMKDQFEKEVYPNG